MTTLHPAANSLIKALKASTHPYMTASECFKLGELEQQLVSQLDPDAIIWIKPDNTCISKDLQWGETRVLNPELGCWDSIPTNHEEKYPWEQQLHTPTPDQQTYDQIFPPL